MKDLVATVLAFASCAYNYAVETGCPCDETILYDVLRTDAYVPELVNAFELSGAYEHYANVDDNFYPLPQEVAYERDYYACFLRELRPVFDRCAKAMYADAEPPYVDADKELDEYIEHLLKEGCLQPEEKAYLADERNRVEMKNLYNEISSLMNEPVDRTNEDSCTVGAFIDFDEVFSIELFLRVRNYMEQRYAEHDLKLVESNSVDYTDTDKAQAEYINRTMHEYNKF